MSVPLTSAIHSFDSNLSVYDPRDGTCISRAEASPESARVSSKPEQRLFWKHMQIIYDDEVRQIFFQFLPR
jgi:hypothetical protein